MKTALAIIVAALALCLPAIAQVAPAATGGGAITFSTTAEATALCYAGSCGAAAHTTESLDLIDWGAQMGNSLNVEGHEIVASPFKSYLGGIRVTPDLSGLFSKTNLPADSFQVFSQFAFGVSTLPAGNQISYLAGGGVSYRITPNLAWSTVDFHYLRVGSQNGWEGSTGLVYFFNPGASQALAMKRMIARRAKLQQLKSSYSIK